MVCLHSEIVSGWPGSARPPEKELEPWLFTFHRLTYLNLELWMGLEITHFLDSDLLVYGQLFIYVLLSSSRYGCQYLNPIETLIRFAPLASASSSVSYARGTQWVIHFLFIWLWPYLPSNSPIYYFDKAATPYRSSVRVSWIDIIYVITTLDVPPFTTYFAIITGRSSISFVLATHPTPTPNSWNN